MTNPEQRSILFTRLLEDRLQRPAGTRVRNVGGDRLILGLVEGLQSKFDVFVLHLLLVGDL